MPQFIVVYSSEKLRKSVNICQSYQKNKRVSFFMAHSVDYHFMRVKKWTK